LGDEEDAPTVVAVAREAELVSDHFDFSRHEHDDHIQAWSWIPIEEVATIDLIPSARQPILDSLRIQSGA
jgi:hypothetical protein